MKQHTWRTLVAVILLVSFLCTGVPAANGQSETGRVSGFDEETNKTLVWHQGMFMKRKRLI